MYTFENWNKWSHPEVRINMFAEKMHLKIPIQLYCAATFVSQQHTVVGELKY